MPSTSHHTTNDAGLCPTPRKLTKEQVWEVVEGAGTDQEQTVFEGGSFAEAARFVTDTYSQAERVAMGIDILKNGSTEF